METRENVCRTSAGQTKHVEGAKQGGEDVRLRDSCSVSELSCTETRIPFASINQSGGKFYSVATKDNNYD